MKERRMQGMLKQTEIKYIRRRGNFVQNVNQISEKNKQNKHWDTISKKVLPDVLTKNYSGKWHHINR